jgi:hypothetical protein
MLSIRGSSHRIPFGSLFQTTTGPATINTDILDLQHGPGVKEWARDGHSFINDVDHRHDVMTCGLLSRDLLMETRGLGLDFLLLVWLRESTRRNP